MEKGEKKVKVAVFIRHFDFCIIRSKIEKRVGACSRCLSAEVMRVVITIPRSHDQRPHDHVIDRLGHLACACLNTHGIRWFRMSVSDYKRSREHIILSESRDSLIDLS